MPVRPFNPQIDMERVVTLYIACFAESPWFERFTRVELEAGFREMLAWPDTLFLVETGEDDVVIGASERLGCCIVARQDVVSQKWIAGVEQQVPDTRVLMTGEIPDYAKRDLAHEDNMYTGCWHR